MSDIKAFQTQYAMETVKAAEQRQALLSTGATKELMQNGSKATFLLSGSGGTSAVSRGPSGNIPYNANALDQIEVNLVELHDARRLTNFNVFASQGNQRLLMQENTIATLNRSMDDQIINALDAATTTINSSAQPASVDLVLNARKKLGENLFQADGQIYAVISPAFSMRLMRCPEFTSVDYVNMKPFEGISGYTGKPEVFVWSGVNWIVSARLKGAGTSSETCYMWHKSALGHAVGSGGINATIGYNDEQDYHYARASVFSGAALLQNTGVVKILHDAT